MVEHNRKKRKKSPVPFRLNIVFFAVFILFSILVIQLGVVQILEGADYQAEIDRTIDDVSKIPVPRGEIYDRKHELIVDNKPAYSITYTPAKRVQSKDKLDLAEDLAKYMDVDKKAIKKVSEYNKKEYWYLKNTEKAQERVSEEEIDKIKKKNSANVNSEIYALELERVTEKDIANFTEEEIKVMAIKRELDKAYALTPQIIKNENISLEEYATIAEHLHDLPGINVSTDWDRDFLYGNTLKSIIGSITTQDQGIPADKLETFLAKGYNRNDRVGTSGLEEYYEDALRGRKEQIQYTTTKGGVVLDSEVIVPGERGKDLVLSIDIDYQKKVDEIVEKELKTTKNKMPGPNRYLQDALAVVLNPKTGEVYAMSAIHYNDEDKEYQNAPFRTLYDAHRPGSTVKGATVLTGLSSGVISPGQSFADRRIQVRGTVSKGSYSANIGTVNDITALKKSSNVYMFYIALRMVGEFRYPFPNNSKATFNESGVQEMRNYFQQLGLGARTGIDFPFEATGYVGPKPNPGLTMDLGIGQYDTYTTMQLAQYVSTIANDGYRVQPKIVQEIRTSSEDGKMGSVYQVNETHVLNKVDAEASHLKRVQEGFWSAFNSPGGTGYSHWAGKSYKAAGKTGTAENAIYENGKKIQETENLALVGYAPYDDPEVAFAVIAPHLGAVRGQHPIAHAIGTQIMDAYFDMKVNEDEVEEDAEEE